ncbi:hypothetical protein N9Y67_00120 [Pseudomonadota bacterium]|nr:hypothetical protein [Pseudomonadota bacterium]
MDSKNFLGGAAANPPLKPVTPSVGYPTDGNGGSIPPTTPGAFHFYKIGAELNNVITGAGLTPNDDELDQLWQAILSMVSPAPAKEIGEPFALFDHLPGVLSPDNSGAEKYIKLTAGLDGVGEYNEGLLISETFTNARTDVATDMSVTAVISHANSPMNGAVVSLINTEVSALRPDDGGDLELDAIRNIAGSVDTDRAQISTASGAFTGPSIYAAAGIGGSSINIGRGFSFDASLVVPTDIRNQIKSRRVSMYMRIL